MNKDPRITPARSRWRDWTTRQANDSTLVKNLGYWIAQVPGVWQLRLRVGKARNIPWAPLKRPLAEATVALLTTGGAHLCNDTPFILKSDASYRLIPRTATSADLCITHEHYDRRDAARDINLIFPLERLLELEAQGIVGRVADAHYGFGFVDNPHDLLSPGHELGVKLKEAGVDLALLVPG